MKNSIFNFCALFIRIHIFDVIALEDFPLLFHHYNFSRKGQEMLEKRKKE